jgi:Protein of unknown function (DUF2500)
MSTIPKLIFTEDDVNVETVIVSQVNTPQPTLPPEVLSNQSPSFDIFSLIFFLVPILVIGVFTSIFALIAYTIIKNISIAANNRKQPVVSREAKVVTKRQDVWGGHGDTSASTSYYITFEFIDGSREEFSLSGREYGLIAEGDRGTLNSQGTWYKDFQRRF